LRASEVREIIAAGKSIRAGVVSLKYLEKPGFFRAAVVAPKSVLKGAVERNRVRRALYQVLATLPPGEARALNNTTAVFFIRNAPTPLTSVLRENISGIVKKLPSYV
jgi:ribonuclease P protein component